MISLCSRLTAFAFFLHGVPAFSASPGALAREKVAKSVPGYSFVEETGESRASEYVMRRYPGEQLMPVRILAGVKNPGTYYLPEGTDLVTAVSLAGGLTSSADSDKVNWNQWATKKHEQLSLDEAVKSPEKRNPVLGNNDVLFIEESKPWISNNTVTVVSVVATLLGIALSAKALSRF